MMKKSDHEPLNSFAEVATQVTQVTLCNRRCSHHGSPMHQHVRYIEYNVSHWVPPRLSSRDPLVGR